MFVSIPPPSILAGSHEDCPNRATCADRPAVTQPKRKGVVPMMLCIHATFTQAVKNDVPPCAICHSGFKLTLVTCLLRVLLKFREYVMLGLDLHNEEESA